MVAEKRVYATCPRDCYDTCAMYAYVDKEGRLAKVEGRKNHGLTKGFLCRKGQLILDWVYSPDRLRYPMKRAGPKGGGRFQKITWDETFRTIINNLKKTVKEYGPTSVLPYEYAGHMGVISRYYPYRFFNRLGATQLLYTICSEAGKKALTYHYGTPAGMDPEDVPNSRYVVFWGFNPAWTSLHLYTLVKNSKAKMVVVDPVKSETAEHADLHIQPRPGTDSALALGVVNYAIVNGLYDKKFIEGYTYGFNQLRTAVKEYTPEKVCDICDLDEEEFRSFAKEYGTSKPAAILMGLGLQRNVNGGEMVRAISLLPAITGNIGVRGGGFFYSNSSYFTIDWKRIKGRGKERRKINMIKLGEALLDNRLKPPIKFLFVYNSNPAAVCPDQNKVRKGLSREDLFTVVHDLFLTDTAEFADIVLPATSYFETFDIQFTYGGLYVALNERAVEPLGECKSNAEVFTELSKRMGFDDIVEDPEVIAEGALKTGTGYMKGITLRELKGKGFVRLRTPTVPHIAFGDLKFNTPTGKIELYSRQAEADGVPPIPAFTETKGDYPIRLITPFHRDLMKSQYYNIKSIYGADEQVVEINKEDASARGIRDGGRVRIFNQRGDCIMRAKISGKVKRGIALSYGIAWPKLVEGKRTSNFTTSSHTADLGGGSAYHTNYVYIEVI
jgi:anaerobic selenocysteine-containing dehydrogenase